MGKYSSKENFSYLHSSEERSIDRRWIKQVRKLQWIYWKVMSRGEWELESIAQAPSVSSSILGTFLANIVISRCYSRRVHAFHQASGAISFREMNSVLQHFWSAVLTLRLRLLFPAPTVTFWSPRAKLMTRY